MAPWPMRSPPTASAPMATAPTDTAPKAALPAARAKIGRAPVIEMERASGERAMPASIRLQPLDVGHGVQAHRRVGVAATVALRAQGGVEPLGRRALERPQLRAVEAGGAHGVLGG